MSNLAMSVRPWHQRKWRGIPVPVIALLLAVLLAATAAYAAVMFRARIEGSATVKAAPSILWIGNPVGTSPDGATCAASITVAGVLTLAINGNAFPGTSCTYTAMLSVPVGVRVRVTGIDLGPLDAAFDPTSAVQIDAIIDASTSAQSASVKFLVTVSETAEPGVLDIGASAGIMFAAVG